MESTTYEPYPQYPQAAVDNSRLLAALAHLVIDPPVAQFAGAATAAPKQISP